ncbi:protein FAM26F [Carlito syrichta]|uniref:Protein FAM26F n=1 Tax=Carlito syrichta TaxID=1868482 RepID=A0A1U7T6Q1_CARSF|nr:protein FAM26F [Carlito syrichta]
MKPVERIREVLDLHLKHRSALAYGLVTLLTAGGERLFSATAFQCPCSATWNQVYGLFFLLAPALALLLLSITLSARVGRLFTGRTARARGRGSRAACVCVNVVLTATLAPCTWVAVALLGGSFYQCAASGTHFMARLLCPGRDPNCSAELPLVPCNQARAADVQALLGELRAQSQVFGIGLITIAVIAHLLYTSITQCRSPVSFMQLKFWKIYLKQEQQLFKSKATEHAMELAKENIKCFFEGSRPKHCHTPSPKDWQQISSLYTFSPNFYSMLHKYVNTDEENDSIKSSEGVVATAGLDFVDSPDMNSNLELETCE